MRMTITAVTSLACSSDAKKEAVRSNVTQKSERFARFLERNETGPCSGSPSRFVTDC
jgi:hypothetical protein